jgi:hypothetical protein
VQTKATTKQAYIPSFPLVWQLHFVVWPARHTPLSGCEDLSAAGLFQVFAAKEMSTGVQGTS